MSTGKRRGRISDLFYFYVKVTTVEKQFHLRLACTSRANAFRLAALECSKYNIEPLSLSIDSNHVLPYAKRKREEFLKSITTLENKAPNMPKITKMNFEKVKKNIVKEEKIKEEIEKIKKIKKPFDDSNLV